MPVTLSEPEIRSKIIFTLCIYPKISPSMLQSSLAIPVKNWKHILEALIEEEKVTRTFVVLMTPSGRNQTHQILSPSKGVLDMFLKDLAEGRI